jgi:type II secretory pathway component PulF
MPGFTYKGLDNGGRQVAGRIIADDERTAVLQIKGMGLFPVDVRVAGDGQANESTARSEGFKLGGGINSSDLTVFSRQLANLVSGGLPLMRTFAALTEHTESPRLRVVMQRMQQDVQSGKALWEALSSHPRIFPTLYVSMVKAGEASGQLSEVLLWLADYQEKEQARKMQIRSALVITVGLISVFLLVTFVVPRFVGIFEEFEQALPMPTIIMLGVSGFLTHWWWLILGSVLAMVIGLKEFARTTTGRLRVDGWKLKMPLFGKLALKTSVSRFARTTATLLKGGVPLLDSMVVVREVVGNEVLSQGADRVREGMREGESFAVRLKDTGVFPPLLTHMVAVGEETGDLQGTLLTVANSYDVEVDASLKSIVSLLEPLIIITVGSMIAFIIMAMLLPVFQLNLTSG